MVQDRSRRSGARKTARKSPTAHSITAVIRPKRVENQLARQKAGSRSASA